jgi:ABC-type glycerol-3-phosphate transport system permease component
MSGEEIVTVFLIFSVLTAIFGFVWMLSAGAKDKHEMSVPAMRILAGEERYPRLPALSALPDDDAGVDVYRPARLSGPAAKGFKRDATLGRDAVTQEERNRWIKQLDENRWGKSN